MRVVSAFFSHKGPRESNQDRVLSPSAGNSSPLVAAIADGIGGAPGGEQAASIAIDMASKLDFESNDLSVLFDRVVVTLQQAAAADPNLDRMGTTLSVALFAEGHVAIGHVGDTRIYHLRGRGLNSLTQDQTEVAELVRKGVLPARNAKRYPRRNVLLSALSPKGEFAVQETRVRVQNGDRLLLVTDGVHQRVPRGAILKASIAHEDVHAFVRELEQLTLNAKPSDNFSAVAVQIIDWVGIEESSGREASEHHAP